MGLREGVCVCGGGGEGEWKGTVAAFGGRTKQGG